MLRNLSQVIGSTVEASDDSIGHVRSALFDDRSWAVRYLVVETGNWLAGREVLISPYSVRKLQGDSKVIKVALTRQQVDRSPDIDTHQPVSRQHERDYLAYYEYPQYWGGGGLWGISAFPVLPPVERDAVEIKAGGAVWTMAVPEGDAHLRSSAAVTGYDILATDESIGHVKDFLLEEDSWAIRYLLVDTRNWWPGGRKVLVGTQWITRVDWATRSVHVALTREQVKSSPQYHDAATVDRAYEQRLHAAYQQPGYWDAHGRTTTPTDAAFAED